MKKNSTIKILKYFSYSFIPLFSILILMLLYINNYYKNEFTYFNHLHSNEFLILILLSILIIFIVSLVNAYENLKHQETLDKLKISGSIFQNSSEAIVVTDVSTNIIYVNKAFLEITGHTENEVIGLKTSSFKSGKHDKEFYKNMWESIKNNGTWQGEIWDKRKNGELYPKHLIITAIKSDYANALNYVGIFEDLTALKEKEKNIDTLKNYDQLTLLPNLSLFKKIIDGKMQNSSVNLNLVSLIISNYDTIKDSVGLKNIDSLITKVLKKIKLHSEKKFIISRTGDSEFMILIEMDSINTITNKFLINTLNEFKRPFILGDDSIYIEIAIGVSSYPTISKTIDTLIEDTNIARTCAANSDEKSIKFYEPNMKDKYLKIIKMENLLRGALEKNEFFLVYQPQIDLLTENIIGVEALIRWNSPELGMVSPAEFIPIAEKIGVITPIGEWVLNETCKKCKEFKEKNLKQISYSVNISPVQFRKVNVLNLIKSSLEKYALKGNDIQIEITESVLVENIPNLIDQLNEIKALGVKLSLDDFGTGYSSLSYLRKFNFDKIKIDREFIKDYPQKDDGTISKTIINLAHSLKMQVIAEGAETEEQIEFLKNHNCHQIQGYYYSPPISPEKLELLLGT